MESASSLVVPLISSSVSTPVIDPELCPECRQKGATKQSIRQFSKRLKQFYRWRRHRCVQCDRRWSSWQYAISPRKLRARR